MSYSFVEKNKLPRELEETMVREYSYLLYIGGLLVNYRPVIWIISMAQTAFFITVTIVHTLVFIMTTAKSTTFVSFSQNINYASLSCIALGLYFSGLSHRDAFIRLLKIMTADFYDYGDSFDNAEVEGWKKQFRNFKIIIVLGIPVYLIFIAASIVLREYIDAALGYQSASDGDYQGDIYQKTPMKVWYPFEISDIYRRLGATLLQMLVAAILATTLATGDVLMLFLGQTVALQLRILCLAATKIDQRAKKMHEKGSEKSTGRTLDLNECYRICIKQLVEHHLIIKEFYSTYYLIAKWPTAIAFMNGSLMIAMSIIVAMNGTEETPSTYISAYLLLVAEIMSMWLLCETGQNVNTWSEKLFMDTYEFNWLDISVSNKKLLLIFKENIKKPLLMMAGGLTPINRDTFATIMNTSYSYVNLLRASEKRS